MEGVSLVRSASFKERAAAAALRAEAAAHEQRTQQDVEALADVEAELTRLLSGGAPGEPAGSGGSWICSQCTFENRSLPGTACAMCGCGGADDDGAALRHALEAEERAALFAADAELAREEWAAAGMDQFDGALARSETDPARLEQSLGFPVAEKPGFRLSYSAAHISFWVEQQGPACAAASVAGVLNALSGQDRLRQASTTPCRRLSSPVVVSLTPTALRARRTSSPSTPRSSSSKSPRPRSRSDALPPATRSGCARG